MSSDRLTQFITHPDELKEKDILYLEDLIKTKPYFQLAHVLLLYSLKKCDNEKFDQQLRESAIHIPDRRKLYNLLYHNPEATIISSDTVGNSELNVDESIEFQFEDYKSEITIDEPTDITSDANTGNKQELLEIEEVVFQPIDEQPRTVEFDNTIEEVVKVVEEKSETGNGGFTLIDKFIGENPAFTPNKLVLEEQREDISVPSVQEDDSLVTETLASIFEMQKLYEKAISVYEKLILKIPEKSTYFASRINELKKNIK